MSGIDFNKLVDKIRKLRERFNEPNDQKEDTFTVNFTNEIFEEQEIFNRDEPEVTFMNNICYQCNGYYGPCFGDPLCATCHLFLYPASQPTDIPTYIPEQNSDSDSGNDEPIDTAFRINGFDNSDESSHRLSGVPCSSRVQSKNHCLVTVSHCIPSQSRFISLVIATNQGDTSPVLPSCSSYSSIPRSETPPVNVDNLAVQLQRLSIPSPHQFDDFNFDLIPPEVLIHTFQYLDEISLWSIGQVCSRWRSVLFMYVKQEKWKEFTARRWPLLVPRNLDQDWYELYTAMMRSTCCFKCVQQMAAQELPSNWDDNSWRAHRLRTELRVMRTDPLDGIEAIPLDPACCHWQATLEGPAGSSYEGGLFFLYIQVPVSYPLKPPIVRFITKIFHPNVSRHGDIGIDSIHQNWSLALTMSKLLISIQSLLTDPFCDVCMEPDICKLYITNRKAFEEQARKWTAAYAMHDMIPH